MKSGFLTQLVNCGSLAGEVVAHILKDDTQAKSILEHGLHIDHYSASSDRVKPHLVLHTISKDLWFKLSPISVQPSDWQKLKDVHETCIKGAKTAVVLLNDDRELHLVAMSSKPIEETRPCFWAYACAKGLYSSCLRMLNMRCLGLVFDLDETLLVANTSRSFEDRIDALERKIRGEHDPAKRSNFIAECNRFKSDRVLLRQFVEKDELTDEAGVVHRAQPEVVNQENGESFTRPVLRLAGNSIILTRINPAVRDTSVLVRMRPSWEELRQYVLANNRKRFEVYVCTMSEREYALEMWRLLDPEAKLISIADMADRVVCVRSDMKKSLASVFQRCRGCHPSMAIVVDDRLKVWVDADQPRVHVVPAYTPYHSQAEMLLPGPILRVVLAVACGARGDYFKFVDSVLDQRLRAIAFDTDATSLPEPPDVATFLIQQEVKEPVIATAASEGCFHDGMVGEEVAANMRPQAQISAVPATVGPQVVMSSPPAQPPAGGEPFAAGSLPPQTAQMPSGSQGAVAPAPVAFQSLARQSPPASLTARAHLPPPLVLPVSQPMGDTTTGPDTATRLRMLIQEHGQESPRPQDDKTSIGGGWGRARGDLATSGNLRPAGPGWPMPRTPSWGHGSTPAVPVKGPPEVELEAGEIQQDDELPEWDDQEIENEKKNVIPASLSLPPPQGPATNGIAPRGPAVALSSRGAVPDGNLMRLVGTLRDLMSLSGPSPPPETKAQLDSVRIRLLDFMDYNVQKKQTPQGPMHTCEVFHKGEMVGVATDPDQDVARNLAADAVVNFFSRKGHASPPAIPPHHPFPQPLLLPPGPSPIPSLPPQPIPHPLAPPSLQSAPPPAPPSHFDPSALVLQQVITLASSIAQSQQQPQHQQELLQQALHFLVQQAAPQQQSSPPLLPHSASRPPHPSLPPQHMASSPSLGSPTYHQGWPPNQHFDPPSLNLPPPSMPSPAAQPPPEQQHFRGGGYSTEHMTPHPLPNAYPRPSASISRLGVPESPGSRPGPGQPGPGPVPSPRSGGGPSGHLSWGGGAEFRKPVTRERGHVESPSARPSWLNQPFVENGGGQRSTDAMASKYDEVAIARAGATSSASQQAEEIGARERKLAMRDTALKRSSSYESGEGSGKRPRTEDGRKSEGVSQENADRGRGFGMGFGGNGIDLNLMPENDESSPTR